MWKDKLKKRWKSTTPLEGIIVGAFVATAAAKLLDSMSASQGRRAYARQVDYRINQK